MAIEGVDVDPGTGAGKVPIACDLVGSDYFQSVKIDLGGDGASSPLVRGQQTAANSIPVTLPSDQSGLSTSNSNTVDANNSTTTPLAGGATFTGTGTDVTNYTSVGITLYADQASASDGMKFQFSTDNSNWDDIYSFNMAAGETRRFQFPICAQYFRIVYTNGGTIQGAFRMQTILHQQVLLTSIHRIEDNVSTDRSATLVKAGLVAQVNGSGDFVPIQANSAGVLKIGGSVDVDSLPADVAAADGAAYGKGLLIQGDDGTDRRAVLVDTDGHVQVDVLSGGIAGTEYTEDTASSGGESGPCILGIRRDADTSPVTTDGDFHQFVFDAAGALKANVRDAIFAHQEDRPHTNEDYGVLSLCVRRDADTALSTTDNDYSALLVNDVGLLKVTVRDAAFMFNEDSPHTHTDPGVQVLGVRNDSDTSLPSTDGDYTPFQVDASGFLKVNVKSGSVTSTSSGDVAHSGTDSGNPVKIGAKAEAAAASADLLHNTVSDTGGSSTAFTGHFAAAGANIKNAVTALSVFRTDAGTGMAYIDFRDGVAGSVLYRLPLPEAGGAVISNGGLPLFLTSGNTALAYDVSGALTTVYISVSGFKMR
jgi:hypothetical protein